VRDLRLQHLLRLALEALAERRTRSALTVLGILIGPAAILGITSMVGGYRSYISDQLMKFGTNTMAITPSGSLSLGQRDVQIISSIRGVKGVYPYYYVPAVISWGGGTEDVGLFAVDAQGGLTQAVPGLRLLKGQYTPPNMVSGATLGYQVANPRDPSYPRYGVGSVVTVEFYTSGGLVKKSFMVTGVLAEFGQSFFLNVDSDVFVPLAAGQTLTGSSRYSGLLVVLYSSSYASYVQDRIYSLYGNQLTVYTVQEGIQISDSIMGSLNALLVSAAAISLVVAFVGVTTTMFTSTTERTREIGLLKALGFRNRDVVSMFVAESAIMGVLGGAAGDAVGVGVAYLLSFAKPASSFGISVAIPPVLSWETGLLAFALAAVIGTVAGVIPAYKASRLTPMEALRHERKSSRPA